jgi:thioredoxin 1
MAVTEVTSGNFSSVVLASDKPVLVDFWAVWCGPCKMVSPIVSEIAEDFAGKIGVYKLDVDNAGDIAANYGVSSIPTLILFSAGREAARCVGAKPKGEILKALGLS